MGSLLENLYDILFNPKVAFENIAQQKPIGQAVIVFLLSVLIPNCAIYFGLKDTVIAKMLDIITISQVLGSLVLWLVCSAVWHLIAEFCGGRGSAAGLFINIGFAHFPKVLIVPLWVLATLMPMGIKNFLLPLSGLIIVFWTLTLDVVAIKSIYQFSSSRAVLVLSMPIIMLVLIFIIILAFVGSTFMHMPMWL